MSSFNPFRKKPSDRLSALDTGDSSGYSSPSSGLRDEASPEPPAGSESAVATEDKKPKLVKKVRVLSPPPLSPDSPEWSYRATLPTTAAENFLQSAAAAAVVDTARSDSADPFDASVVDSDRDSSTATPPPPRIPSQLQSQQQQQQPSPLQSGQGLPANPFSKTLHDLENVGKDDALQQERQDEGAALKAGNAARKSLNVDSFRQLLMTGNSDTSTPRVASSTSAHNDAPQPPPVVMDSTTAVNTNLNAQQGAAEIRPNALTQRKNSQRESLDGSGGGASGHNDSNDDDESQGFNSASDSSANVRIGSRGKKAPPPPPSSRHGRSLTLDLSKDNLESRSDAFLKTPSDINKALPLPPAHSLANEDVDSPFDREAAGKVPDWEPVRSPLSASSNANRKSVPAPPPRRGHARAESRSQVPTVSSVTSSSVSKLADEESMSLSRSSSTRHSMHAPAPPPPRRPHTGSRQVSATSPTAASFTVSPLASPPASYIDIEPFSVSPDHLNSVRETPPPGAPKLAAPPPPPKRNTSVRRPLSVQSVEAISRRVPRSDGTAPPPPPPRTRGSSRSSLEGPPRRLSSDSFIHLHSGMVAPQSHAMDVSADGASTLATGKGVDILADLTALQREVDALRGKLN
jgi:hypothetical protein